MENAQEEMPINNRFAVLFAKSMLDLALIMNQTAYMQARLVYFGENKGTPEFFPDVDVVNVAPYIAIFDLAPVVCVVQEDLDIAIAEAQEKLENDTSDEVSSNIKTTLSA